MIAVRRTSLCNRYALMVALAALLFVPGCGREESGESSGGSSERDLVEAQRLIEEAIEKDAGSKVDVDLAGDSLRIRGRGDRKDYSFAAGGKIKVPESFPDDVSLYPEAELRMAQESAIRDVTVILASQDGRDAVLEFYRTDAAANGWELTSEAGLEGEQFLGYIKEGKALTIAVDPEGESTIISISYKVKG